MDRHTAAHDSVPDAIAPLQQAHEKAMQRIRKEHERSARRRQRAEQRLEDKFQALRRRLDACPDPAAAAPQPRRSLTTGILTTIRSLLL
ncbi:hypothetical protein Dde_3169 [Oleidesulfovibrio alaskensis G20]|uniref:Uncharacterized protein n=1 Tax=Oleidesulfovibrio alaskensis (strain ATCC BAA-1058 / DSM 17464 / G20) TaxID=207559 RepID=Q30WI3_OLEA2|nr:hypothetical protein [Oleidesulfovibrio alaskensis]ABB39963.1 hypothetical protein Dde_3169 [Oleidesulfovibrio alaskensis G20]MBG0774080.1 hypothetical protein [Oleidesulfovibrio alaskensis]